MTIQLRHEDLVKIQEHGVEAYPHECCGVLLGKVQPGETVITDILPLRNSREGAKTEPPKASQDILNLLQEAYGILQRSANTNEAVYAWLERADEILNSARNRFRIMPEDLMRSDREAQKRGVDLLGFYHSHPDHPARPSEYDRQHMLCPWYTSYLILSVPKGVAGELTGWSPSEDGLQFVSHDVVVLAASARVSELDRVRNSKGVT